MPGMDDRPPHRLTATRGGALLDEVVVRTSADAHRFGLVRPRAGRPAGSRRRAGTRRPTRRAGRGQLEIDVGPSSTSSERHGPSHQAGGLPVASTVTDATNGPRLSCRSASSLSHRSHSMAPERHRRSAAPTVRRSPLAPRVPPDRPAWRRRGRRGRSKPMTRKRRGPLPPACWRRAGVRALALGSRDLRNGVARAGGFDR